jgi:hypothetical protein
MRKVIAVLSLAAAGAVACATSSVPASSSASEGAPTCASTAREGSNRVHAAIAAHVACAADADCVVIPQGARCFDQCTTVVAKGGVSAIEAVVADVDARECADFAARGCRVEVPPCAPPPTTVSCRSGVCT